MTPDLGVVANFGQIFGAQALAVPRYGMINYHPSLLPRYRGPSPFGHILLNQETRSGATWHRVAPAVDQGDILAQKSFGVAPQETLPALERKSVQCATQMLGPLIEAIAEGTATARAQSEADATYFPKLTRQEKGELARMGRLIG